LKKNGGKKRKPYFCRKYHRNITAKKAKYCKSKRCKHLNGTAVKDEDLSFKNTPLRKVMRRLQSLNHASSF
jgi:hypothetical protein